MTDDPIQDLVSENLTEEDQYYLQQGYQDPVQRIARIEDVAKFLAGATATTSGLYLAAFKIAFGARTAAAFPWLIPHLLWSAALILFVLVLLPQRHPTHQNDPASWKAAFIESGRRKHRRLLYGAILFILGILAGAYPFGNVG